MKHNHRRQFVDAGTCFHAYFGAWTSRVTGRTYVVHDMPYGGHRGHAGRVRAAKRALRQGERRYYRRMTQRAIKDHEPQT